MALTERFFPHDYAFFADESGISGDRFTVVGGIAMHRSVMAGVYETLKMYRRNHSMEAELKWAKVSDGKLTQYHALVDYFFALNNSNQLQFHSIVFDNHQWNHHKYNDGERDHGISKLYFQLILHKFVKLYGRDRSLFVCLDHRNSKTPHEQLRLMLNRAALRDLGMHSPVREIVSRDSHADDLLQLNDVILGAVCAARNGKHLLAETRAAKKAIAEAVLEKSGLGSFDRNSPWGIQRFTVWNMRARPR